MDPVTLQPTAVPTPVYQGDGFDQSDYSQAAYNQSVYKQSGQYDSPVYDPEAAYITNHGAVGYSPHASDYPTAVASPAAVDTPAPIPPEFEEQESESVGRGISRAEFSKKISSYIPDFLAPAAEAVGNLAAKREAGATKILDFIGDVGDRLEANGFGYKPQNSSGIGETISEVNANSGVGIEVIKQAAKSTEARNNLGFTSVVTNLTEVTDSETVQTLKRVGKVAGKALTAIDTATGISNLIVEVARDRRDGKLDSHRVVTEAALTTAQTAATVGAGVLIAKGAVAIGLGAAGVASAPAIAVGALVVGGALATGYVLNKSFNWIRDKVY